MRDRFTHHRKYAIRVSGHLSRAHSSEWISESKPQRRKGWANEKVQGRHTGSVSIMTNLRKEYDAGPASNTRPKRTARNLAEMPNGL